jgi:hypothetical protein
LEVENKHWVLLDHPIEDLDVLHATRMLIGRKLRLRVAQSTNESLALARSRRLKRPVFRIFLLESPADIRIAVVPLRFQRSCS